MALYAVGKSCRRYRQVGSSSQSYVPLLDLALMDESFFLLFVELESFWKILAKRKEKPGPDGKGFPSRDSERESERERGVLKIKKMRKTLSEMMEL
ncbi:hypothetical protein VNO77_26884 [Canavalia gladiata]|uniref:Uncharacterized protein n=1 Tax=Canavalia gladiata TaxID=3824 RepID=A0AAN9KTN3_CANGL